NVTLSANATSTRTDSAVFGFGNGLGLSPNVANALVLDGGALRYTGGAVSTDRSLTLTTNGGGLDASGAAGTALTFGSSAPQVASTVVADSALAGAGSRTLTLMGTNTSNNTLNLAIPDGAADGIGNYKTNVAKTGPGRWILGKANSYTGSTQIDQGTLALG